MRDGIKENKLVFERKSEEDRCETERVRVSDFGSDEWQGMNEN